MVFSPELVNDLIGLRNNVLKIITMIAGKVLTPGTRAGLKFEVSWCQSKRTWACLIK